MLHSQDISTQMHKCLILIRHCSTLSLAVLSECTRGATVRYHDRRGRERERERRFSAFKLMPSLFMGCAIATTDDAQRTRCFVPPRDYGLDDHAHPSVGGRGLHRDVLSMVIACDSCGPARRAAPCLDDRDEAHRR